MESQHSKFIRYFVCLIISIATVSSKNLPGSDTSNSTISDSIEWNILMRGAKPPNPDAYLCTAYPVHYDEAFIYKFEAMAEASTAHHMLLYGCDGEAYEHRGPIWACPRMCKGNSLTIMFAWAKNAPPTVLPKGVGLRIGQKSRIKTIVLQVHYAKSFSEDESADNSGLKLYITHQRQPYSAGILLMMSAFFEIPQHTSLYPVEMSCEYRRENSIFPFAYRTHSHGLGKVITGYQYNGSYHMIGKGNPQWPQAFYPVKTKVEVKQYDKLAARCTYDSSNMSRVVNVGPTGNDEMCNFYIMYYTNSSFPDKPVECIGNAIESLTGSNFPADVSVPLPHNAVLEAEAVGHHHHGHHQSVVTSPPDIVKPTPPEPTESNTEVSQDEQRGRFIDKNRVSTDMQDNSQNLMKPNPKPQPGKSSISQKYHENNVDRFLKNATGDGHAILEPEKSHQTINDIDFVNYDYDNINPRDLSHKTQEYYDNYAANDYREQNRYGSPDSDVELSRNRNKEFKQQLQQQQYSNNRAPNSRPLKAGLQQRGPLEGQGHQSRIPSGQRMPHGHGKTMHLNEQGGADKPAETLRSNIHIEKKLVHQMTWHTPNAIDIGQVGGVSVDMDGNVYIFHRSSRRWGTTSFDYDNNFRYQDAPIDDDVVLVLDKDGNLVRKFGKGQFFMPHGIKVDFEGNIWLTDVALHQVFKIRKNETVPVLTLGHRFKHSKDLSYFCKPTDVAVLSTGEFFVSDGYCNNRIMKFSKDGKLLKSWGKRTLGPNPEPFAFYIVHSVTVSEKDNLLCAADRENGRIQCFDLDGNYKHIIKHKEFGSALYAVDYSPRHGGVLYAVNGQSHDGSPVTVQGFTMDMKNGALIEQWNVQSGLKSPHAVCVDPSSESVYVGELDPRSVWKMTRMSSDEAKAYLSALSHDDDDDDDHHIGEVAIGNVKKEHKVDTTPTPSVIEKILSPSNHSNSSTLELQTTSKSTGGLSASMIMGIILVVPVVLLLVVVLVVRSYRSGNLKFFTNGGKKRIFNMQHILGNSHKGFDPLSTEESDHDLDPDDSDQEEYAAPKKNKT